MIFLFYFNKRLSGESKSRLASRLSDYTLKEILDRMDLLSGTAEHWYIKNLALMMFCDTPEKFFPYTQIDIVIFPEGKVVNPDNFIEVPAIKGPVPYMITTALNYLRTHVIKEKIIKLRQKEEAVRFINYPYQALEEAVVNALLSPDYQIQEPVEITIEPNRISILSYSGPDRSISMDAIFKAENLRSRRYKNRRLGDYLKELELTEGRGTGIPTIQKELRDNGSTPAILETDEGRSYFLIDIPCHPEFQSGQMEEIYIEDKLKEVVKRVLTALSEKEMSRSEILGMIEVPDNWYYKGIYLNPLLSNKLIKSSQEKKKISQAVLYDNKERIGLFRQIINLQVICKLFASYCFEKQSNRCIYSKLAIIYVCKLSANEIYKNMTKKEKNIQ